MFKKLSIVVILVSLNFCANAQKDWVKQKFDERLTLSFPAETKKVSESTYIARDSTGTVFGVVVVPIDKSSFLSATSTDSLLTRIKFIDVIVGDIKSKMPKYAIGDIKVNQVNNVKTYSLEGINEENKSTVYINIFLVNDISYSLTCFVPAGISTANKDVFFKGFSISK
ncbi:hypothetical protein EZ428_15450 [Pedobacter frigiditerrae]|uniref:Uncharacterized protein n=1 Tax=Pedobacter frigiditerrae TaxID=2530452 RepID=A0A4V2MI59_9SPHI|nr:hypothetical protein [Pedobacter frigiditerrae]TCC89096.1 hypothetical protein EZ428_15450 [Pedobacter frigiditerrae]